MKITYNLEHLPERRYARRDSEEVTAIKLFLAGQQKNMCFEYDSEPEAKRRYDTVRNYRASHKLQEVFDLYRSEKCIYILRTKKKGRTTQAQQKG